MNVFDEIYVFLFSVPLYRFLEKTLVASGGQPTKPLYLLTNKAIGVPVFDTTQNQLVNKVGIENFKIQCQERQKSNSMLVPTENVCQKLEIQTLS